MAAWLDNVKFNPTAGGTTDWTYSTTVQGYQSLTAAGAQSGTAYRYFATSADLSQWELGVGLYTGSGITRATVLYNSSGTTAKINFTNPPIVSIVAVKEDMISIEEANSFTLAQKAQARANISAGSFSAHKNGTDQTGIPSATNTKITFGTKIYDPDSTFDNVTNNRWTPPAGKVLLTAQLWVFGTFAAGASINLSIFKNGSQFKGGFNYSAAANDGVAAASLMDVANGTDYYEVFLSLAVTSGTVSVHGSTTWTWFMGTVL